MGRWKNESEARDEIKSLVAEYYHEYKENTKEYHDGDYISYAGRVLMKRKCRH